MLITASPKTSCVYHIFQLCLLGAQILRAGCDPNPFKVEPIGVPANLNGRVRLCEAVGMPTACIME